MPIFRDDATLPHDRRAAAAAAEWHRDGPRQPRRSRSPACDPSPRGRRWPPARQRGSISSSSHSPKSPSRTPRAAAATHRPRRLPPHDPRSRRAAAAGAGDDCRRADPLDGDRRQQRLGLDRVRRARAVRHRQRPPRNAGRISHRRVRRARHRQRRQSAPADQRRRYNLCRSLQAWTAHFGTTISQTAFALIDRPDQRSGRATARSRPTGRPASAGPDRRSKSYCRRGLPPSSTTRRR